jgi:hypothetical protein
MPTYSAPVCLVVSNGVLQNSSDVFGIIDPDTGGANSFTVKLSANGLEPVTHWACRTQLEVESLAHLRNDTVTEFKAYVDLKAAQFGRQPIGSVTAFKNNVQISADDADFWAFIAGLGLQRVEDTV